MALVSMATEGANTLEPIAENPYGYGLCIQLSPEQCAALGITTPPPAGSVMMLAARAEAKRVTEEAAEADEGETSNEIYLELQITDLEITSNDTSNAEAAKVLYNAAQPYQPPSPSAQVVNPATMTRLG